jgi:hypothetical protein
MMTIPYVIYRIQRCRDHIRNLVCHCCLLMYIRHCRINVFHLPIQSNGHLFEVGMEQRDGNISRDIFLEI